MIKGLEILWFQIIISQGLIMTEMLSILMENTSKRREKSKYKVLIQKVLDKHLIRDYQLSEWEATFWVPSQLFMQTPQQSDINFNYSILGNLEFSDNVFLISFSFLDRNNQIIKGSSIHQKSNLIRLCFLLNAHSQLFQVKTNPLSGQFCFCHSFLSQNINLVQSLDETLYCIKKEHNFFCLVFQFLQKVQVSQNSYVAFVQEKLGISSCDMSSDEQVEQIDEEINENLNSHCQYYFTNKSSIKQISVPQSFVETIFHHKEIAGSRLAKDPNSIGRTNLAYKTIRTQLNLDKITDQKDQDNSDINQLELKVVTNNFQTLNLKILVDKPESVFNEYRKCEKVARKFYLSFLKQYIVLKTQENTKNFIFYLYDKNISLRFFLQKNMLTMSMTTRLKLSYDIALISMICTEALKGFSVKISIDNLLVGKNLNIKLARLNLNGLKIEQDTCKTIMKILFGNQITILNRIFEKQFSLSQNIDQFSLIGPQVLSKMVKKCLMDMFKPNVWEINCGGSQDNLLMVLQAAFQIFEKDQDIKESWMHKNSFLF